MPSASHRRSGSPADRSGSPADRSGSPADRSGSPADEVNAGRRRLAAIDPAVMRRVVGRPREGAAPAEPDAAKAAPVPAHRRGY
ncbi:MAG TPA: hypothetical protein VI248_24305 [Kineosporiaceae bacterium]